MAKGKGGVGRRWSQENFAQTYCKICLKRLLLLHSEHNLLPVKHRSKHQCSRLISRMAFQKICCSQICSSTGKESLGDYVRGLNLGFRIISWYFLSCS